MPDGLVSVGTVVPLSKGGRRVSRVWSLGFKIGFRGLGFWALGFRV